MGKAWDDVKKEFAEAEDRMRDDDDHVCDPLVAAELRRAKEVARAAKDEAEQQTNWSA